MFIRDCMKKDIREVFPKIKERKRFAEWCCDDIPSFKKLNDTERVILFFRYELKETNREEIARRMDIKVGTIRRFVFLFKSPESLSLPRVKSRFHI